MKHKYRAIQTDVDGIKFPSKKQAQYYRELKARQKIGDVIFFLREVPFDLPGNVKYRLDFMEFLSNGSVRCVDVKGYRTQQYIMKKKQVEALYPVKIEEV